MSLKVIGLAVTLLLGLLAPVLLYRATPGAVSHENLSMAAVYAKIATAESLVLANGLQVVVIPDERAADVVHMVWYKVGAADDPPGKSGLAHFLEHLTFSGTKQFPGATFFRALEDVSKSQNAVTTRDFTAYYQTVAPKHLDNVMRLEADRMAHMQVGAAAEAAERNAIIQERQASGSNPYSNFSQLIEERLYGSHVYGKPVDGTLAEVSSITLPEAIDFYRRRYAPNNAIVIVYGPVAPAELLARVGTYYGQLPSRATPARAAVPASAGRQPERLVVSAQGIAAGVWERQYIAPSYNSGSKQYVHPLEVLRQMLAGEPYSRLHQALALKHKMATAVIVEYDPEAFGPSSFTIRVNMSPGADPVKIERILERELHALSVTGPAATEIERVQRNMSIETATLEPELAAAPQVIGQALVHGRSLQDVQAWPAQIRAVTQEHVREAVGAVLVSGRFVTGVLVPQ